MTGEIGLGCAGAIQGLMEPERVHDVIIVISQLTSTLFMLSSPCDHDKGFSTSMERSMLNRAGTPLVSGPEAVGCAYLLEAGRSRQTCGLPRRPKSAYCSEHHALCHIACGTAAEADCLREVELLARVAGGRQGWRGAGPSQLFLDRLEGVVRDFS
jgi:hypothetical protein